MAERPLVTIGVPVRNGARTLRYALASAAAQTYPNFEVVVSDNASDDETPAIVASFVEQDPRFRVVRHEQPLTMMQNHRAVWGEGRGTYFLFLQDDDLLDERFVELLVDALDADPEAVLAFGDIVAFGDYEGMSDAVPFPHSFATEHQPMWYRLWKDRHGGYEIKGLMRQSLLEGYGWYEHTVSPDWPLLSFVMLSGEIIAVPGALLYNGSYPIPETAEHRANVQSFSKPERFAVARVSWRCGRAAAEAAARRGHRRVPLVDAAITFASLLWWNRGTLVAWAMAPYKARYRRLRASRSS